MTRRGTDWIRATYIGAVLGGVFWAAAFHFFAASDASTTAVTAIVVTGVVLIAAGLITHRVTTNTAGRTYAASLVIAPLTGVAPLLPFALIGLINHLV